MVTETGSAAGDVDLLFQAQQLDRDTGLYNMRARNYDPATGRFTQREPVAAPVGVPLVSAYAFVGNRPTVFTDPTGLTLSSTTEWAGQESDDGNIAQITKHSVTAVALGVKAASKFGTFASTSKTAANLKAAGKVLAFVGIALQTYVTVENCMRTVSGVRFDEPGDLATVLRVLYLVFNPARSR